jgi:hypothetical protein
MSNKIFISVLLLSLKLNVIYSQVILNFSSESKNFDKKKITVQNLYLINNKDTIFIQKNSKSSFYLNDSITNLVKSNELYTLLIDLDNYYSIQVLSKKSGFENRIINFIFKDSKYSKKRVIIVKNNVGNNISSTAPLVLIKKRLQFP